MKKQFLLFIFHFFMKTARGDDECGILKDPNRPPWNVGLYIENNGNYNLICLGTAISSNLVITAAHCLSDKVNGKVEIYVLPSEKLDKSSKAGNNQHLHKVKKMFISPRYKGYTAGAIGDVGIIRLQNDIKNRDYMPVCVDWDNSIPNFHDGEKLRHPTWKQGGITMTDVSCVDFGYCQNISDDVVITTDKICAISDSVVRKYDIIDGTGLIYYNFEDGGWYIRGISSILDAEKKLIVYTNLNMYLNWLADISARL